MVPRPDRRDLAIAGSLGALVVAESFSIRDHRPAALALLLAIALAIAWRRTRPEILVLVVALSAAVQARIGVPTNATISLTLGVVIAGYAAGRYLEPDRAVTALAVLCAGAIASVALDHRSLAANIPFAVLICAAPWGSGVAMRRRHSYTAAVEQQRDEAHRRAAAAVVEAEAAKQQAITEERARIARELHDVVSHSLTVISLQAGGVRRLLRPEQERERQALLVVEETSRQAQDEMRRLLHLLRGEGRDDLAPQPGLGALEGLVAESRAAGLEIDFAGPEAQAVLPAGIELTIYRIVQEALTNVNRHAGATRVSVAVQIGPRCVEIEVRDNGIGAEAGGGPGYGIVGMQERVALYGGTLEAGPHPEGGFRVAAQLPLNRVTA